MAFWTKKEEKKKYVRVSVPVTIANTKTADECKTLACGEYAVERGKYPDGGGTPFYFLPEMEGWGWFAQNWDLLARQPESGISFIEK